MFLIFVYYDSNIGRDKNRNCVDVPRIFLIHYSRVTIQKKAQEKKKIRKKWNYRMVISSFSVRVSHYYVSLFLIMKFKNHTV